MGKKTLDLQKLNPNWKLAADHGRAQLPGLEPKAGRLNSLLLCPCCLGVIQKQPVRLWENSKELFFLGYGFPMFYNTLQFCIASVLILILIESGLLLYMSIQDISKCPPTTDTTHRLLASTNGPDKCDGGIFVKLSRVTNEVTTDQYLLRIFSFVAQLLLLLYFRDNQRKMAAYHIQRNIRITDFSLIFKNLPKIAKIKKKINDFLKNEFQEIKPVIQDIFLIPTIDEYYEKEHEKEKMINKKRKLMRGKLHNQDLFEKIDKQMDHIHEEISKVCHEIDDKSQKDELYAQKAIVILQSEYQKVEVLKAFKKMPKSVLEEYFVWMADQVKIKQAPDPKEILWQNINFPRNQRWGKFIQGWVISIMVLGAITAVFYGLIRLKGEKLDLDLHDQDGYTDEQYNQAVAIVFIAILGVQFFNKFLLKIILHKLADLEMPETTSQHQFSYALKYTLGMFFTTAVMTLAVQAIQFENYSGEYGVVEEQTIMFFFNAFFVPLLWITHPQYYIKKLKRYIYKDSVDYTQKQANELMQEFPYDIGKRYAEVIETMWFTFLYSSLIPFGALLTFLGLIIYYWVDKYNLLRRSSISNKIESRLPLNAIKLLEITILWKPIGEFIFDLQLRGNVQPSTIVMMCVALIYLILPWDYILDFLFQEKFNIKTVHFKDIKKKFNELYETEDPIRRQLAIDKFVKERKTSHDFGVQFKVYEEDPAGHKIYHENIQINLITSANNLDKHEKYKQYSLSELNLTGNNHHEQ